eukprot:m.82431 g.82431  ORF g.82431 m.82431 type:complete len:76 (-) comp25515_c0_seq1:446-673(-)
MLTSTLRNRKRKDETSHHSLNQKTSNSECTLSATTHPNDNSTMQLQQTPDHTANQSSKATQSTNPNHATNPPYVN